MKFHPWPAHLRHRLVPHHLSSWDRGMTVRERGYWLGGGTDVRSLIVCAALVVALTALAVTRSAL